MTELDEAAIFNAARKIDLPEKREAYLRQACGEDRETYERVATLLQAYETDPGFLDSPPAEVSLPIGSAAITEGPGTVIGRYKLLEQIGEGGFAVVYLAEQTEPLRRQVALKVIKPGMDTRQILDRFEVERRALALMDHPHIARVFDAGTTDHGRPYFVMELVQGLPITEYCDQKRLTPLERLELFIPVCQAIQHAHQKGIIHRDIKPTNVLVALHDGRPVPKVIDFGIAKATQQRLTEQTMFTMLGQIVGTMEYMSPEQAEINQPDIDTRSDVYSLGVLLYELLTGTTPLTKEQIREAGYAEALRTIREVEPQKPSARLSQSGETLPSISAARNTLPAKLSRLMHRDLDWIVMKSLEKDRTQRYETANAMAADIDRFLREEPIEARPPSVGYKLRKFARRNKALLATLTVIAAILLAASVISTLSAIRAVRAEKLATERLLEVENQRNEANWNQYVARQFPIVDAWQRRDFGHLDRMVNELRPNEGQPDFRGWEWAYFRDQCDQAFTTIKGKLPAWDPQHGGLAVVATRLNGDSAIEVRSPKDGSLLRTISVIPTETAKHIVAMRWCDDGSRVAYSTNTGFAKVLNSATGDMLFSSRVASRPMVCGLDLSYDGRLLAVSDFHGQIEIWNVDTGKRARILHTSTDFSNIENVKFNSAADQLLAALRWGRRTTWNVETGEAFEYALQTNKNGWVSWNRSGTRFAATGGDTVAVFQLHQREPQKTLPHRTAARVAWIGDERLVSSGWDHFIRIWDASTYELLSERCLHFSPVTELEVSADGKYLAASANGEVKLVELDSTPPQATRLTPMYARKGERHYLAWENQGRYIASGNLEFLDRNFFATPVRIWDVSAEKIVCEQRVGIIRGLSWRPDQNAVWATTLDGKLHEFEIGTTSSTILSQFANNCQSSFSPNGKWLLLGDQNIARLVEIDSMSIVQTLHELPDQVYSCRWSHDSSKIALGLYDTIVIWTPTSDSVLRKRVTKESDDVCINSIAWSSDNSALALGRDDGKLQIVAADTLKDIALLNGHSGEVHSIDWAGDGRRIASAGNDGTVRIQDAATGDELLAFHHSENLPFLAVAWSPDSRRLAGGDSHGSVFIWGSDQIKPLPSTAKGLATGVVARRATGK